MKPTSLILCAAAAITFTACAHTSDTVRPKASASGGRGEAPTIRVGMTKSQVIRAWGDPSAKQVTGRGEIWIWGGQNWKRIIPYAGPFLHVQTSKALFGADGRVKDFRLTDKGDVMSEGEGHAGGFNSF